MARLGHYSAIFSPVAVANVFKPVPLLALRTSLGVLGKVLCIGPRDVRGLHLTSFRPGACALFNARSSSDGSFYFTICSEFSTLSVCLFECPPPPLSLSLSLSLSREHKLLGVINDNNLTQGPHIRDLYKSVAKRDYQSAIIKNFLTFHARKTFFQARIQ